MKASKSSMSSDFKVQIARQVQHVMPQMHYHDFYEIYIQDQGSREMIVGNALCCLKPHDVLLLKPALLHQSVSVGPHTRTVVYFTEEYLKKYFSDQVCARFLAVFNFRHAALTGDTYYKVSGTVREMSRAAECGEETFPEFASLMMLILSDVEALTEGGSDAQVQENSQELPPVLAYVHENYLTLTGLKEIASTFYMTPSHLCRTFKKMTGYTIMQYINFLKIHRACALLKDMERPVTEIAMECGFHSAVYFCKTFRQFMDMTPTDYRKQLNRSK